MCIRDRVKSLAVQRDEVETVQTQLVSCLSFVSECLRTGSQGEIMKMKTAVMKQVKEMTDNFNPEKLSPCERTEARFESSPDLAQACQQFGNVHVKNEAAKKCYATGKGLEVAEPGERATAVLHIADHKGMPCTTPVETIACEVVSLATKMKTKCFLKNKKASQYEISYQPTSRGSHQLHIKVDDEHIKGSLFAVTVKLPVQKLGIPNRTINGIKGPWGVAVNQRGEIIVVEHSGHCISIFSQTGKKIRSFGSQGSGHGQFRWPRDVAVDDDGNILVADAGNKRIQKFTSDGKFMVAIGRDTVELKNPVSINIHPDSKKIILSDYANHCLQILNPDLTFHSSFSNKGQFYRPWNVAFDNAGNMYVGEQRSDNSACIQVFTAEGQFLRKFGNTGSGKGELNFPSSISIDRDNVVYVTDYCNNRVSMFTTEGVFLRSFGTKGNGHGQFDHTSGMAMDKDGFIYISDISDINNGRIQIF